MQKLICYCSICEHKKLARETVLQIFSVLNNYSEIIHNQPVHVHISQYTKIWLDHKSEALMEFSYLYPLIFLHAVKQKFPIYIRFCGKTH
jgi:hypothetical protein